MAEAKNKTTIKDKTSTKTASKTETKSTNNKQYTEIKNPTEGEKTANNDKSRIEALEAQLAALQAMLANVNNTQIIQAAPSPKVQFLWQAEVADENVITFGEHGKYGRIVGKTGSFYCPKDELSRVLDSRNTYFLKKRWLIVLSGLDADERDALGVNYKEGELLDRKAFAKMVDLGDEMLSIYPNLCEGHRAMVAQRYAEAYDNGNVNVTRELVTKLNQMSKEAGNAKGDFVGIIEKMNAKEAQ